MRDLIRSVNEILDNYNEKYIKVKSNSGELRLNKTIEMHNAEMVAWAIFHESNVKMLHYDRIDFSKGIDVNKVTESKGCDICHYWYFLNKGFKFQSKDCNRCHDLLMML